MLNLLDLILQQQQPHQTQGDIHGIQWQYWAEGILEFRPVNFSKHVVLSAGIHGNETAPMEILNQICEAIFTGKLALKVRLLVIFGNPKAIRAQQRYVEDDINRMFLGKHRQLASTDESRRAMQLEQLVERFFQQASTQRYHYDLHTAIRGSYKPTFALLPAPTPLNPHIDEALFNSLHAAELDAVVYHTTAGNTFSNFSLTQCQAHSVTLELGKVRPFGQNDLSHFEPCKQMLCCILQAQPLPSRQKNAIERYQVIETIIKKSDDFKLVLDADTPNFSCIPAGQAIAIEHQQSYHYPFDTYTLFLNASVKTGLRAGMLMQKLD